MRTMMLPRNLLLSGLLLLAACGGGGGGSSANPNPPFVVPSPPPPPPPPPPNDPPTVSFSVTPDVLNEGETFIVDLRGSSDSDGTIVNYTVEHFNPYIEELDAVRVNAGAHPEGVFEFMVPEVFEETDAVFEITVEDDDGASTSDSAYLIFFSTVNTPKIDGFGEAYRVIDTGRPLRLLSEGGVDSEIFVEDMTTQELTAATDLDELISNRQLETDATVSGTVATVSSLVPLALNFNLSPVTPFSFLAISEAGDTMSWFADFDVSYPNTYELHDSISIPNPCSFFPRYSTQQDFIWVGQRGGGMSVVGLDRFVPSNLPPGTPNSHWARGFDDSIISQAGGTRSLCHVYPAVLSERLSNRFPQSDLEDVIAVDFDTNELVLFADDAGNDRTYEIVDVVPLQTDGVPGLGIIDVISIGNPGLFPQFLLILMTDGLDNGQHRVVTVYPDRMTNELNQSVHTWQGAAPTKMIAPGSLFGSEGRLIDFGVDLVIISETGEDVVILEDERAELGLDLGPPIFKPAQFITVGSGAGSVIPVLAPVQGAFPRPGFMLSFPASNEIQLWVYRD